jgi:hypothetical protein
VELVRRRLDGALQCQLSHAGDRNEMAYRRSDRALSRARAEDEDRVLPGDSKQDEFWREAKKPLRRKGQALFKELRPLDFLMERKKLMTAASWESEYQQNPIIVGGGVLPIEKMNVMPYWSPQGSDEIIASIRYWDKAGTEKGGAYTAGVLMHHLKDGPLACWVRLRMPATAWSPFPMHDCRRSRTNCSRRN